MAAKSNLNDYLPLVLGVGALYIAKKVFLPDGPIDYGGDYHGPPLDQHPTLSQQRMLMLADRIEGALLGGGFSEDEEGATAAILECVNDADVLGLISAFGVRSECQWCLYEYTLPEAVRRFYSSGQLQELNAGLARKGITFTF